MSQCGSDFASQSCPANGYEYSLYVRTKSLSLVESGNTSPPNRLEMLTRVKLTL